MRDQKSALYVAILNPSESIERRWFLFRHIYHRQESPNWMVSSWAMSNYGDARAPIN